MISMSDTSVDAPSRLAISNVIRSCGSGPSRYNPIGRFLPLVKL